MQENPPAAAAAKPADIFKRVTSIEICHGILPGLVADNRGPGQRRVNVIDHSLIEADAAIQTIVVVSIEIARTALGWSRSPKSERCPRGDPPAAAAEQQARGSAGEVFAAFLKLGLTSFGGPIAHLGYFRKNSSSAADGSTKRPLPTSSRFVSSCRARPRARSAFPWRAARQRPFRRARRVVRLHHALGRDHVRLCDAARRSFTGPLAQGFLHGLKLVAVAVIAQAIWGMTQKPDARPAARRHRAGCACGRRRCFAGSFAQVAAIVLGALRRAFGSAAARHRAAFRTAEFSGHANARRHRAGAVCGRCCCDAASPWPRAARTGSRCSTHSTARARWCLAAAMSCCRCCRRKS